jgi:hypothetical protein
MSADTELRKVHVEQLVKLLALAQDVAHKLANESHGRSYDQVRELNEILHLARRQVAAIEAEVESGPQPGVERRRAPRSRFADLE